MTWLRAFQIILISVQFIFTDRRKCQSCVDCDSWKTVSFKILRHVFCPIQLSLSWGPSALLEEDQVHLAGVHAVVLLRGAPKTERWPQLTCLSFLGQKHFRHTVASETQKMSRNSNDASCRSRIQCEIPLSKLWLQDVFCISLKPWDSQSREFFKKRICEPSRDNLWVQIRM